MIVSIHQPHFLPWMGYINKIMNSDAFVILNTVQYRPRYYQNRAKVRRNETEMLLSIPVHSNRSSLIKEVTVATDQDWAKNITSTIEFLYRKKPFYNEYWPAIRNSILKPEATLDDVNFNVLMTLLQILEITHVKIYRANEMPVTTVEPTERLLKLCQELGATHYISGRGGRDYMRVEEFEKAGIFINYQDIDFNNVSYSQGDNIFVPGLSVIDAIFNIGSVETRKLTASVWKP
jgi:hypothetical protein